MNNEVRLLPIEEQNGNEKTKGKQERNRTREEGGGGPRGTRGRSLMLT